MNERVMRAVKLLEPFCRYCGRTDGQFVEDEGGLLVCRPCEDALVMADTYEREAS